MFQKPLVGVWATCALLTLIASPTDASAGQSTPYTGNAVSIPGTIEAENFDNGGEGVAYHDTTAGNALAAYRQTDVDIQAATEGGYNVGKIKIGEWLNYSINVSLTGKYALDARVAALDQGGTFHVEFDGVDLTGPLTIPNTGAWQNWTTVSTAVVLAAGPHAMRVVFDAAGPTGVIGNLNWIRLSSAPSTSFTGSPVSVPGTLNAENFDNGGEGVAYHDTTAGNSGGAYRNTDVDIQTSSLGGYNIGWTTAGEWLAYSVNVTTAGPYTLQFKVASKAGGGQLHANFGQTNTATIAVPTTGAWQTWTTVSTTVTLAAGVQVLKLVVDTGGFNVAGISLALIAPALSAPAVPNSPNVADGALGVTVTPNLSWQAAGATSYDLRLGTSNPPATYTSNIATYYYSPATLTAATKYYWQVVAKNAGGTTTGPVWSFTTEGATPPPPPPSTGTTICVAPATGCASSQSTVQAALNAAAAGDTIILHAGTTYTEGLTLPNKGVLASYITITTDASAGSLPAAGVRTGPSFAAFMPKIKSPNGGTSAVSTAAAANHYRFTHIEFPFVPGGYKGILSIGAYDSSQTFESQEPSDVIIDQCYIHGDPVAGQKNGIDLNAKNVTITNSYISDIAAVGQESHGIVGINGHGPYDIENNYIEAAGINILFGGGDPPMHTYMRVTGSASTTGAAVQTYETGHTLAELRVGQNIAVLTAGGTKVEYTNLTGITGTGATGTLTWSPALSVAPDSPGDIRAGVIAGSRGPSQGITVRRNYMSKKLAWMNGVLAAPTGSSATPSIGTGTLAANTYFYKVQAFSTKGYQNSTVNGGTSAEVSATLSATGQVTVSWTAVPGATIYRVWRGTSAGVENQYATSTTTSLIDNGSLAYTAGTPGAATLWIVKNLLEFKAAWNVQVDSNVFENHWKGSDVGYAWWIKSVNQDGGCWFCQSRDLVYEKNIVKSVFGWVEVHGQEHYGATFPPPPLTNVTLRNNLIYDSVSGTYGQGYWQYAMLIMDTVTNLTIDHNTVIHTGSGLINTDAPPQATTNPGVIIRNNMLRAELFGIHASTGANAAALTACCPSDVFTNNAVADGSSSSWPAGNTYEAATAWENEFVAYSLTGVGADYHIKTTSTLHNAGTDGKDVGADIDLVNAATNGVRTGSAVTAPQITTTPPPPPPPAPSVAVPTSYNAATDRTIRPKPAPPALGPAGFRFTDPTFGSNMLRVTDATTQPTSPNLSYRTPSASPQVAWNTTSQYFYVMSTVGTVIPYSFDASTMKASRLAGTGDGGLTLKFANEPAFSAVDANALYGQVNTASGPRTIARYDFSTGQYSTVVDLDTIVSGLAGTYVGGMSVGGVPTECMTVAFGGGSQDQHHYLMWFPVKNLGARKIIDTTASTLNGVPTNILLNFKIHAVVIDKSGRYITLYPTATDLGSPRYASQVYVWDTTTDIITAITSGGMDGSPDAHPDGHATTGYGYGVNHDCCVGGAWDAAQWLIRSFASPLSPWALINPVLTPKEIYLSDHLSWNNAQPNTLVPVISATYRYGDNTTPWRAWDDEVIAIETDAPAGTGATVWRFAHHRSDVASDTNPLVLSFWYTPRPNVSPDGRWVLFTSNWEKTLGADPKDSTHREDVFVVQLK